MACARKKNSFNIMGIFAKKLVNIMRRGMIFVKSKLREDKREGWIKSMKKDKEQQLMIQY